MSKIIPTHKTEVNRPLSDAETLYHAWHKEVASRLLEVSYHLDALILLYRLRQDGTKDLWQFYFIVQRLQHQHQLEQKGESN